MDSRHRQGNSEQDDALAYGEYHGDPGNPDEVYPEEGDYDDGSGGGERGIIGDTYRKVRSRYQQGQHDESGSSRPSGGLGSFIFHKLHDAVNDIGSKLDPSLAAGAGSSTHSHTHTGTECSDGLHDNERHRYGSFAPQRSGNDAKYYVDGCAYFWAVSRAIERSTTSIWILDCKAYYRRSNCQER